MRTHNRSTRNRALAMGVALFTPLAHSIAGGGFDCLIEPAQTVEVAPPVSGLLSRIDVTRGSRVIKGQLLAQLESSTELAALDLARFKAEQNGPRIIAEHKFEHARLKFARIKGLADEHLLPAQDRDDAEHELKLAEAEKLIADENRQLARLEYQQQQALIAMRTMTSPFDGVVIEQHAHPGEIADPRTGQKGIVKLAQLDPAHVRVILPKEFFGRITPSMSAEVVPEIPFRSRVVGRVKTIDRLVDAGSGTFVVVLELPNPRLEIPVGVKCRALFAGLESPATKGKQTGKSP